MLDVPLLTFQQFCQGVLSVRIIRLRRKGRRLSECSRRRNTTGSKTPLLTLASFFFFSISSKCLGIEPKFQAVVVSSTVGLFDIRNRLAAVGGRERMEKDMVDGAFVATAAIVDTTIGCDGFMIFDYAMVFPAKRVTIMVLSLDGRWFRGKR